MIWVLEDRYESPLSIDTKNVPVALRLTSQWWFNDVIVTKNIAPVFLDLEQKQTLGSGNHGHPLYP